MTIMMINVSGPSATRVMEAALTVSVINNANPAGARVILKSAVYDLEITPPPEEG